VLEQSCITYGQFSPVVRMYRKINEFPKLLKFLYLKICPL